MKSLLLASLIFLTGCIAPLKPGHSAVTSASGTTTLVQQSQNPKSETKQKFRRTEKTKDGAEVVEEVDTTIGAAQKDVAREIGAKLASMRWMQVLGVLMFLFGVTSLFYPLLKAVINSATTSLAIAGAGLALMFLPVIVVGNETLLLTLSLGAVAIAGVWFFAIRHGRLRGFVDANKDGIDDRRQ